MRHVPLSFRLVSKLTAFLKRNELFIATWLASLKYVAQPRQTAVDIKCISYALAYLNYWNKYLFTAYVTANVKYVNAFVCMTFLHKIVVFRIFDSACQKRICGKCIFI